MMKYRYFAIFSTLLAFMYLGKNIVLASEILTKYNMIFVTDPATGLRYKDGSTSVKDGYFSQTPLSNFPGATNSINFRIGGTMHTNTIDPNSPVIGYPDDCYPDDPNNPEGNIIISGRIVSNFTNKPVNGAAVAIYMGAEHLNNRGYESGTMNFNEKFVVGGKDVYGRLTNLYHYDISKDGTYKVYACNAYKQLSTARKQELANTLFKVDRCPDGYVDNGSGCNFYDYTKAFPKFSLAIICGMTNTYNSSSPSPIIGEIYSVDNNNDAYKGGNPPSYMQKNNFDIRVNCSDSIPSFPIPMFLDYASPNNIASCRMDDVSSNIKNYFNSVQKPMRNYAFNLPTDSLVPDDSRLPQCTNPDDIFCLKNFITRSFQKPQIGKNVFNYGSKTYLSDANVNPVIKEEVLKYATTEQDRHIDLSDGQGGAANERNFLAKTETSTFGQFDAKLDVKSYIDDVKFDLSSLKDLYACFTTFNAPATRTNAELDELNYNKAKNSSGQEYFTPNLRIPSCKELYCGQEFIPDNTVCRVKKPSVEQSDYFGNNFSQKESDQYIQLNALTGYGPGVTLSLESQKDIAQKLLLLVKDLVASDFNPKKAEAGAVYKPVSKVSDIVACMDDNNQPVYLNDNSQGKEGSITYSVKSQSTTFYSPVPLMSFLSIPYNIELFHSVINDNYKNKYGQNADSVFPEQCNGNDANQKFADCRSGVIPGGVYSVSALRLIAQMCNNATKIPTPDAGNFNRVMGLTGENLSSTVNNSILNKGLDIDLNITRIGTPVSLCLCKAGDYNCSYQSRLNNLSNPSDFAISSYIGDGDQNNGNNYLGVKCENTFESSTDKTPQKDCIKIAARNGDKNVPINDVNYAGGNDNLFIKWKYSYTTFDQGKDANHEWISYQWDKNGSKLAGYSKPQTNFSDIRNVVALWKGESTTGFDSACVTGGPGGCLSYPRLNFDFNDHLVSKVESDVPRLTMTPHIDNGVQKISYYDGGSGDYLNSPFQATQRTRDGTVGYVKGRMALNTAKYDPIPDLLNDFRKYSVYGSVPGGEEYCRSPKLGSIFNFKIQEYDATGNQNSASLVKNRTKGVYCNAAIPDELKRCDKSENWVSANEKSPEDCKYYRCMSFCQQLTGSYYLFLDSKTQNYYCINQNPNEGVEMQVNQGDEGCVLDYVKRMKTVYSIPAEVDSGYISAQGDTRYDKSNYPVYNNNLCFNPSSANPADPSYKLDGKNCMPFVGSKLIDASQIKNTQKIIPINIQP